MTTPTTHFPPTQDHYLPMDNLEFINTPWPWFDRLLTEQPTLLLEDGTLVLSRYDDVVKWGKHPTLVAVPPDGIGDSPWAANLNSVLLTEGDRHKRIRRSFTSWLTPKACRQWAQSAADSARAALDQIGPDGIIDGHMALGVQPAQDAMAHALGVPRENGYPLIHATNLTMMSMGIAHSADDVVRAHEGFGYMMFEAERLIEEKRRNPGDGMLLDAMIKLTDEGGLTERELKESIQILWGSAAHNPGQVMASALADFAEFPDILPTYRDDPDQREGILLEIFRRALPEVALDRFTTEALEVAGVQLPRGAMIRFILGAALRDPDVFPEPDKFDPNRPKESSALLAFGFGTHNCAGQAIARAVLRAVMDTLVERYTCVELVGDPIWSRSDRHRNCEYLSVRLT